MFNGELVKILLKALEHHGNNWDFEVTRALWSYWTSVTRIRFTPFLLVHGKETLLLMEVEIPTLKMLEKVMGHSKDALTRRLLQLQEAQLGRISALDHYTKMQDRELEKINKKIKKKGV